MLYLSNSFLGLTKNLLDYKKQYGLNVHFYSAKKDYGLELVNKGFDIAFRDKQGWKGGQELLWREWLLNGVFPQILYEENKKNLKKLLRDERFYDKPSFFDRDTYTSFIGRMSRIRYGEDSDPDDLSDPIVKSFLYYTLERWKDKKHRSMPHFYFDVESPEWVWAELMRNRNQIKSGRTSVSCVMNISLRWDSERNITLLFFILKHSQWSHVYGDYLGADAFMKAICKELKLPLGEVHLYFISITMDEIKRARKMIEVINSHE